MSEKKQFAEVTIGSRVLKLSPLPPQQLRPCRETCERLQAAVGKPMDEAWFNDLRNGLAFIFLCAKSNHPGLLLNDLEDEADPEAICSALDALGILTLEDFVDGGK